MTRDILKSREDRDAVSDAEIYAALWAHAPFPRLPADAPEELKALTVEVRDPRRLYVIHRARRRHNFQLLVERYILQIRYGCTSSTCTTTTCFSCRKLHAAGAPIRRYNATSARTLAIYMASQDNPEKGLCHHPPARRPSTDVPVSPISKSASSRGSGGKYNGAGLPTPMPKNGNFVEDLPGVDAQAHEKARQHIEGEDLPGLSILEEPTTTDPRSFVQNVFGTVAYKMLEWLNPRNVELLAQSQQHQPVVSVSTPIQDQIPVEPTVSADAIPDHVPGQGGSKHNIPASPSVDADVKSGSSSPPPSKTIVETLPPDVTSIHHTVQSPELMPKLVSSTNIPVVPRTTAKTNGRKKSDTIEPQSPKSFHKSQMISDTTTDLMNHSLPTTIPISKRKMSHQTLMTSPTMHMAEPQAPSTKPLPPKMIPEVVDLPEIRSQGQVMPTAQETRSTAEDADEERTGTESSWSMDLPLPQSMSSMTIETIGLLCDIMQNDGSSEKHILQPESIDKSLKRHRAKSMVTSDTQTDLFPQHSAIFKIRWKMFTEQSFFDVLGNPDSLLISFSDRDSKLFDSHTIWYLMLRMTRVAPSLVFDTLWNVVGTLFRPPARLEKVYDWAKDHRPYSREAVSNEDAARVINICLLALVAASPLVVEARQLANMSRIRSYGSAMLGRETSSLEPVPLCLQYEDAFTHESAFRLARRLFAAIPTRRRFTELLNLQNDVHMDQMREPDILDTIIDSLKFLDPGTPPLLNFSDADRDLHETRAPLLILDWARTVMLQEWEGAAEAPKDGAFGGALAVTAALYHSRKFLLLGDIHFRTEYFAERLDPVDMPLEWLQFTQNKRTVHLLDHPWLFNPATLVTYFRAINYSRMNQAFEKAHTTGHLVSHFMQEGSLMVDKYRREQLHERLRTATSEFMVLEIRRTNVLVDTFNSIWRREKRELMRPLKIRLGEGGGEEGLDSGGVQQEFFRLAIAEALNVDFGTFTIESRTNMTWFQPGSPEPLWKFELIGMIVSLAVYNGLNLPVTFPKALYRKLLDHDVTELHHIADGWPDLTNGLTSLLEWDEKDGLVEDIFARTYEFSVEQFGQPISREMNPSTPWPQFSDLQGSSNPEDAPMVTNENRNNYVSDYIRWLTDVSIRPQFDAFKTGFFSCIDRRSLTLFDPQTLQSIVEGIQEIDISEMRRATRYIGWDASHKSVRDFWSIVKRFDLEQKRHLLAFVTASDRVPVGGMRNLQFTLQRNGVDDGHLPSSYTCYGILLLPEYSSKDVLREKLAMALENSKGFGFA